VGEGATLAEDEGLDDADLVVVVQLRRAEGEGEGTVGWVQRRADLIDAGDDGVLDGAGRSVERRGVQRQERERWVVGVGGGWRRLIDDDVPRRHLVNDGAWRASRLGKGEGGRVVRFLDVSSVRP